MGKHELTEKLKQVSPFPNMEPEIFFALKRLLPMLAIELFITNSAGEFILVQKKGAFNGWALPGGFLGLNEGLEAACRRIAQKYLDAKVSHITFFTTCNLTEKFYGKDNGHAVVLIFKCNLSKSIKNITYFKNIPKDILKHHKFILEKVLSELNA